MNHDLQKKLCNIGLDRVLQYFPNTVQCIVQSIGYDLLTAAIAYCSYTVINYDTQVSCHYSRGQGRLIKLDFDQMRNIQ